MKNLERKLNKIEFVKLLLLHPDLRKCEFCKYYWKNYNYSNNKLQHEAMNHFSTKCKDCINSYSYLRLSEENKKNKYWYTNKFKPLYDWEEIQIEGVNNE
ncbi:MAG: hypothetical protein ACOC3V_02610 [bacterium]